MTSVTTVSSSREAVCVSSCMAVIAVSAGILLPALRIVTFECIIGIIILWRWVRRPAVVLPLGLPEQLLLQVGDGSMQEDSEEVGRKVRKGERSSRRQLFLKCKLYDVL